LENGKLWSKDLINEILANPSQTNNFAPELQKIITKLRETFITIMDNNIRPNTENIDGIYEGIQKYFQQHIRQGNPSFPEKRNRRRRAFWRYILVYACTQDLFNKNPRALANHIRNGTDWCNSIKPKLSKVDIEQFYNQLWNVKPRIKLPYTNEIKDPDTYISPQDILHTITVEEITRRLARLTKNTAPGLDGIQKIALQNESAKEIMRLFFNLILVTGLQPTKWHTNQTTLIGKDGKDLNKVGNYRPITIASVLSRLFWGVIHDRIKVHIKFTPWQKGFMSESGCFNNIHILNEIIRHAKTKNNIVAIFLDVSKAFDTIPHEVIPAALVRKGLPEPLVRLIMNSYSNMHTVIGYSNEEIPVSILRGVKQGDPLSPLIFNSIFEPLLLKLEEEPGDCITPTCEISSLAFADDLLLLANDTDQIVKLTNITESYLADLGMKLAPEKCIVFQIVKTRDTWYMTDPQIKLNNGGIIPTADAIKRIPYLGTEILPWMGLNTNNIETEFCTMLIRIKRLALKPTQKITLLTTHTIPHYLYKLSIIVPTISLLRRLDLELCGAVKDILHLPQSIANGLLYCSKQDGGLTIPKLEVLITSTSLTTGYRFLDNQDPIIQTLSAENSLEKHLEALAKAARINLLIRLPQDICAFKRREKKRELHEWALLSSQGKAVKNFAGDKLGNAWLYDPRMLKSGQFITALQMRSNVAANKVALNRA
jgi:hypothetical protein